VSRDSRVYSHIFLSTTSLVNKDVYNGRYSDWLHATD